MINATPPATRKMPRLRQNLLIGTLLPLCWLLMQAVHELGHVAAAVATGGTISRVVLHPLTISRTDLAENPHPLLAVWAGPVVGVLLPAFALAVSLAARFRWSFFVRFFAGFCLVANGAYIGAGSFAGIGDCGEMLGLGTPAWCMWAFGVAGVAAGLGLWNGLGRECGIGKDARAVDRGAAYVTFGLLLRSPWSWCWYSATGELTGS